MIGAAASPVTVVVPLPPSYRGGTEEYAYRVAAVYARSRSVRILTTTVRDTDTPSGLEVSAARIDRLHAREVLERPLLLSPTARAQLWGAIRQGRALQLHMPFPLVEAPAVRVARKAGVATVLTYHMDADLACAQPGTGSEWITNAYRRLSAHPALDACDVVVSNSWGYARASPVLSRHLAKVRVIRKGVDLRRLGLDRASYSARPRPSCVPPTAVPPGRARLLFLGRLVPYKGVSVLLDAVHRMVRAGQDVGLLIAGRGPLEPELRRGAQAPELQGRVTFLGFVPDAEIGDLYRYADVVVAPSLNVLESTATTLEEAACCGTPVVGSALPGTSETVPNDGRRGLLVAPGNPDALADAVSRMLGAGRLERPPPARTWEETALDYLRLFAELEGRSAPPDPHRRPFGAPGWAGSRTAGSRSGWADRSRPSRLWTGALPRLRRPLDGREARRPPWGVRPR